MVSKTRTLGPKSQSCRCHHTDRLLNLFRRKSDIENERLPPDLIDADSEEGKVMMSQPVTPEGTPLPPTTNGAPAAEAPHNSAPPSPISPASPTLPSPVPFKRGHGRQASLGTTMTSPSTRRRSVESTMSLIKEAYDTSQPVQDPALEKLAEQVASTAKGGGGTTSPR